MNEAAIGYRSGTSFWHGLDVRFKLVFMVMISFAGLKASLGSLAALILALLVLLLKAGLSIKALRKLLAFISIFLALVFAARAFTTPGSPVWAYKTLTITRQGIYDGLLVCGRLVVVIMVGLALVAFTRTSEIKAAVEWFLKPLPFVPEKRVSLMISLLVRFIPVVFNQAAEISAAQRARGVENRKNPVYRLQKLLIPLMRATFVRADKLALAMEARCYTENRTDPELSSGSQDWATLVVVLGLCVAIVVL